MYNFLNNRKITGLILWGVLFFLVFINLVYFYLNLNSSINSNNYAFSELFINYQAGFVRRGFLGEIFWQLNNIFLIQPKIFFSIFFFIIYIFQIFLFYKIFKKFISSKFIFLLISFSPAFLLFHIYDPNLYFIKDSIIKLSIILHAFIFIEFSNTKRQNLKYLNYLKFLILPILFLIIITHEYQIFYLGVHFLISLSIVRKNNDINKLIKLYSVLIIPFVMVIIFLGDQAQFENLTNILKKFNIDLNPHLGGGIYKYLGAFYKWHFFYFSYRDFLNLFFSILLSIFVFFVLFQYLIEKKILVLQTIFQKNYLIFFLPALIPIMLTTDHGRNISLISFHLFAFYSILMINHKKLSSFDRKIYTNLFLKISLLIFLFFYIFLWKLDQFAGFGLQGIPNDIFQSSLFAEIIKFTKYIYQFIDLNIINLPEIKL